MDLESRILAILAPFLMVLFRLTGLFVFAPMLSSRTAPRRFRVLLAASLALAITPLVLDKPPVPSVALAELPLVVLGELAIGAFIGLIAMLPIFAMDMAGVIMGHQMGFGLARVYNPDLNAETDAIGQLLMLLGTGAFLVLGGLEALFVALVNSFEHLPPGSVMLLSSNETDLAGSFLQAVIGGLTSGTELAIRVSAPAVAIILALLVAMALLMKSMPQMNVMSVGFTIKIAAALAVFSMAMPAIFEAFTHHAHEQLADTLHWSGTPHPTETDSADADSGFSFQADTEGR